MVELLRQNNTSLHQLQTSSVLIIDVFQIINTIFTYLELRSESSIFTKL